MRKATLSLLVCAALLPAVPALAEQDPLASRNDPRMRLIPYSPEQVVHLSTAVGATLVVGFGQHETVTSVAVTDSKDLKASPAGNFLFFKSGSPLPLQPVIVLTTRDDGSRRRYVFEVETVPTSDLSAAGKGIYYSVQFVYPGDEAVRRRTVESAKIKQQEADQAAQATQYQLQATHEQMEREARDPFFGSRNWHYVAQGDHTILPIEVWDNGNSTVFRFPGNVRVPSLFVLNPDGKEATANYAVKNDPAGQGSLIQTDRVARGWRLRDGQTVLCIWNQSYDAIGRNTGTDTSSQIVQRVTKEAPR